MRVLMNALGVVSGGAVSYLRHMVPRLSARFAASGGAHRLRILAHVSQRELCEGVPEGHMVWLGGERRTGYGRFLWEWRRLGRIVEAEAADVLFTPYQVSPRLRLTKEVLLFHNMEPFLAGAYAYSPRSRLRNALLRRASLRSLRAAQRVIAVSQYTRDFLEAPVGVAPGRIRRIYHGRSEALATDADVEADERRLEALGVKEPFILTPGSLLPYRRCEDVIEAFGRLKDGPKGAMQLVIAGSGTDARYRALIDRRIEQLPCRDRIRAVGHVPWESMAALYRQCRLCVIASEIEACPNIAIEAMTAGCVIVASDRPPLPEMFAGCSLSYPARNIGALTKRIEEGMEDTGLRQQKSAEALERAQAFSWERCAQETYTALVDWE